jgi:hypothetical protein
MVRDICCAARAPVSMIGIGIAVVGLVAAVLIVRRASAAKPPELGAMSGQWIAERRAGQPEDQTH